MRSVRRILGSETSTFRLFSRYFHSTKPYSDGIILTPHFVIKNKNEIDLYKNRIKLDLQCQPSTDLHVFVDTLFDYHKMTGYLKRIDQHTCRFLSNDKRNILLEYEDVKADVNQLNLFFKNSFLPIIRTVFQNLSLYYEFNANLSETSNGILLDEDYLKSIKEGKLILDFGEDAHGPFPHIVAAFVMKELEKDHEIKSAIQLYQSLAEVSSVYCPQKADFQPRFFILLDQPIRSGLTMFCNPSTLSNHLMVYGHSLQILSSICRKHSTHIMNMASQDWDQDTDKPILSKGKIRDLAFRFPRN